MELKDIICTPRKLKRFASVRETSTDLNRFATELCRKDSIAVETLFNTIDMKRIETDVSGRHRNTNRIYLI